MILAAAITEQWLYFIAAAAYGVFVWWNNQRNKGSESDQGDVKPRQDLPNPRESAAPPKPAESEQERLRRFLEALGVPAAQQPQPPKPAPSAQPRPVVQPAPPRQVQVLTPRSIATPAAREVQPPPVLRPRAAPSRPVPRTVPVVKLPEPLESMDPGRLEESAQAIEQVGPGLGRMAQEMRTMSGTSQAPEASPGAANALFTATQARSMVEIFRKPETLRAAILAQEILGPPRSLQS